VKILTLNINALYDKTGPWPARRARIADLIAKHDPDVVALQAVRRNDDEPDQAEQLDEALGGELTSLFAPTGSANGLIEGPALLSRLPFADSDTFPLTLIPNLEDPFRRLILYARFDRPDGESLRLFNGHFSWVREQAQQNVEQALSFLNRFPAPRVLVGDLNNPPDSAVFDPLRAAGWKDAWELAHPGQPGPTYEAGTWSMRIDYAWLDWELSQRVQDIRRVGFDPDPDGMYLSDHCGLLLTLDWPVDS
jgi:endonuclease/exonuclease/phosphatase family metal-dependent hydrolase